MSKTPADFTNKILHGDCLEVLRTLPDACVDAVVTDPPYGLGNREPTGEDIQRYLDGERLDTGGDFMGKEWDIPPVAVWKECLRVLKPGGYVLAFAGTRTWDIMSIGIRAAGFENRRRAAMPLSEYLVDHLSAEVDLKLTEYRKPDPAPWEEFVFYDHPSTRFRIHDAMRWRAAMGTP